MVATHPPPPPLVLPVYFPCVSVATGPDAQEEQVAEEVEEEEGAPSPTLLIPRLMGTQC